MDNNTIDLCAVQIGFCSLNIFDIIRPDHGIYSDLRTKTYDDRSYLVGRLLNNLYYRLKCRVFQAKYL